MSVTTVTPFRGAARCADRGSSLCCCLVFDLESRAFERPFPHHSVVVCRLRLGTVARDAHLALAATYLKYRTYPLT